MTLAPSIGLFLNKINGGIFIFPIHWDTGVWRKLVTSATPGDVFLIRHKKLMKLSHKHRNACLRSLDKLLQKSFGKLLSEALKSCFPKCLKKLLSETRKQFKITLETWRSFPKKLRKMHLMLEIALFKCLKKLYSKAWKSSKMFLTEVLESFSHKLETLLPKTSGNFF